MKPVYLVPIVAVILLFSQTYVKSQNRRFKKPGAKNKQGLICFILTASEKKELKKFKSDYKLEAIKDSDIAKKAFLNYMRALDVDKKEVAKKEESSSSKTSKKKESKKEKAAPSNTPVYTANTGTLYHTKQCRWLWYSKHSTTLGAAKKKGFTPHKQCNAPK